MKYSIEVREQETCNYFTNTTNGVSSALVAPRENKKAYPLESRKHVDFIMITTLHQQISHNTNNIPPWSGCRET